MDLFTHLLHLTHFCKNYGLTNSASYWLVNVSKFGKKQGLAFLGMYLKILLHPLFRAYPYLLQRNLTNSFVLVPAVHSLTQASIGRKDKLVAKACFTSGNTDA